MSLNENFKELLLKGIKIIDEGAAVISPPPPTDLTDPTPIDPTEPIPVKPMEYSVSLHQGRAGDPDPHTWKVTEMLNPEYEGKWKITDDKGVNMIQEFSTEQKAKDMIAWVIANLP